ncbi:cell division control protein 48C [Dorcoceras hygrometricum]|uniref:Cell division control protein 48C n=1 Tax=Dorcoceras hygrometricum TaxID=472368 RepID=A0A2Z7BXP0_9LAMI|nr:cell division control protein 48C [Dorcoceras hygrometricum]
MIEPDWATVAMKCWPPPPPLYKPPPSPPTCAAAAAARLRQKIVSGQFDEENPFVQISSVLLVQADEGVSFLVVDRIGDIYRNLPRSADVIVTTVGARHKCQQESCATRAELVGSSNMQATLSKLETENAELRSRSEEMLYENQRLAGIIISWTVFCLTTQTAWSYKVIR